MSALAVIKAAADFGIKLSLDGDRLAYKASRKVPPELMARLKANRDYIIELLSNDPTLECEAAMIAAELAKMNAVEARFQAELAALRIANARAYSNRTPWRTRS
jgi:TubC N-terminal docking domain